MTAGTTIGELLARALAAYEALQGKGEEIEDEWSYVSDLSTAWRERMGEVAAARGSEVAPPDLIAAIDRVITESGLIADPHRAIDWLSTFPQVVLVALGEGL